MPASETYDGTDETDGELTYPEFDHGKDLIIEVNGPERTLTFQDPDNESTGWIQAGENSVVHVSERC